MSLQSGKKIEGSAKNLLDPDLDARVMSLRKAELELEEILQDPGLEEARREIAAMRLQDRRTARSNASAFIKSSLSERADLKRASEEIKEIRIEISKSDINELSAEWVREWHRKKQSQAAPSPAELDRKAFVASALTSEKVTEQPAEKQEAVHQIPVQKKASRKIFRYTSLAAAAVVGIFLAISTLTPSSNSEKILSTYYAPYIGVSTISRGSGNNLTDIFNSAVLDYNNGDYAGAEAGFSKILSEQPSNTSSFFYLGLAQYETMKTAEAIKNLNSVVAASGSFSTEARWYLGLAYLRNEEKDKAADCFNILASSEGYYSERAARILRRLK